MIDLIPVVLAIAGTVYFFLFMAWVNDSTKDGD